VSERLGRGKSPSVRFLAVAVLACALIGAVAPAAGASSGVRFGIQDDAWLVHGPGDLEQRLDRLELLGVDLVRFNLHWDQIEATRGQPAWEDSDAVLEGLHGRGIGVVIGLVGSPRWANGGKAPNFAPSAASFADFARAAATRYRWVREWLIWNEPNQVRWLRPTTAAVYVRQILNPAYAAIHAVNPRAKVGGGVTAPRASAGGVSPVAWIRGMRAAGARLDAYAHHPYPSSTRETPFTGGCGHCTTITMATLERLLSEVGRAFGPKRIWLTEYGYQTGRYGVSQQRQAELIGQSGLRAYRAPRVDMLVHYLVKDEPQAGRFQSGLFQNSGAPKLAALAFPLPLAQAGRSGGNLVLWGQVRPRAGVQTFRVQVRTGGVWRFSGGFRKTGARGFFSIAVPAARGTAVRIFSPQDRAYSAYLTAR
jgi:polysaccharide biosynthesis protein PslG